ncbi:MAG: BamA/TamA family outer membrane protein [Ignavibacteriae bacterium]|nr:BamA/TamA family outer membrane protein [Ignavibacteriota bacterium]
MTKFCTAFLLLFFLPVRSSAQSDSGFTERPTRVERFWNNFEDGLNQFVNKLFDGTFENETDSMRVARQEETRESPPIAWAGRRSGRRYAYPGEYHRIPWTNESADAPPFVFRYNRVEGMFVGLGSEKKFYWEDGKEFAPFGSIGYGFASHTWRANLGVVRQIPLADKDNHELLEFGVEGYSLSDSKEQWLIALHENTLAALLLRQDFRDYFERNGATFHTAYYKQTRDAFIETKAAFSLERFGSLDQHTAWALFGGRRVLRTNPPIDDGRMHRIQLLAGLTTSRDRGRPHGWSIQLAADIADARALGGDFRFSRYVADIRRFQPLTKYDQFNIRLRVGSSLGTLPRQMSYELGGLGTVPAYAFKSINGNSTHANRMILMNAEYLVNGDFLGDLAFWPSWLLRHLNLLLLADAGWVSTVGARTQVFDGFGAIHWNDFKSDYGIGLANRTGTWRLALLWPTDRAESAHVYFRIAAPF